MGIPYWGLGLITLVGTTHDTSLWYVTARGRRLRYPCRTLMHGGSTAHNQAGMTCHIALAAIRRLPLPQTQAMKTLLLRCHPCCCAQHRDGGKRTQTSHTLSSCITPGPHRAVTISSVMPQQKNPGVAFRSCHHSSTGRAAVGASGNLTPSTCTLFRSPWIASQALEHICPECRSAHPALGHPLSARSRHVPHSGAAAHR